MDKNQENDFVCMNKGYIEIYSICSFNLYLNFSGSSLAKKAPEVFVYHSDEMAKYHNPVLRKISLKIPEKFQSPLTFRVTPGKGRLQ